MRHAATACHNRCCCCCSSLSVVDELWVYMIVVLQCRSMTASPHPLTSLTERFTSLGYTRRRMPALLRSMRRMKDRFTLSREEGHKPLQYTTTTRTLEASLCGMLTWCCAIILTASDGMMEPSRLLMATTAGLTHLSPGKTEVARRAKLLAAGQASRSHQSCRVVQSASNLVPRTCQMTHDDDGSRW